MTRLHLVSDIGTDRRPHQTENFLAKAGRSFGNRKPEVRLVAHTGTRYRAMRAQEAEAPSPRLSTFASVVAASTAALAAALVAVAGFSSSMPASSSWTAGPPASASFSSSPQGLSIPY